MFEGEWLEYTTDIQAGIYDIALARVSGSSGTGVRLLIADNNSETEFTELGVLVGDEPTIRDIDLSRWAGSNRVIRVEIVGRFMGLDKLEFVNIAGVSQTAYVDRAITADTTTRIELEEFDFGGQDVAYFDTSVGNETVGTYRRDEDVEATDTLVTDQVFEGEWLEYTTDIEAGAYDVTIGKAWSAGDSGVKLSIGETNSATEFTELGQFVFGTDESLTPANVDLSAWAGTDRVIRIEIVGNWMGLNWIDFAPAVIDTTAPTADIVDMSPDPRNSNVETVIINFEEDVTGFDVGDLSLTVNGNPARLAGAGVTQITPRQYSVNLTPVTVRNGTYQLTLNSAGSGIQDMAGNELAADAVDQFVVDNIGPQVEAVIVNDGGQQRSMVSQIEVHFSEEVIGVDASSFLLMHTTTNAQVMPMVSTQLVDGRTVATLTFSGPGIIGGSLSDGNYSLTTVASRVQDLAGNHLDGNGDGDTGDSATDDFSDFTETPTAIEK